MNWKDLVAWLKRAVWWVRYRTTDRHHIINISGLDGYSKGWIDRDHALYLACFKLLTDFVEKESPDVGKLSVEDYTKGWAAPSDAELEIITKQVAGEKEIRALYEWWNVERPAEKKRVNSMLEESAGKSPDDPDRLAASDAWWQADRELDAKDDEMLLRLIKVRGRMWT